MLGLASILWLFAVIQLVSASIFSDVIVAKMSYYRALAKANPVTWDDSVISAALSQAINASLDYDVWYPQGQIIFAIGRVDGRAPDIVNATYFAVDHWWAMREKYSHLKSDDYDDFMPFYPAWEFTQMVWDTNTKVGCAWSNHLLKRDMDDGTSMQLVCLLTPGGNKWEGWGAHVHCPDCKDNQPQTSTHNPSTMTFAARELNAKATSSPMPIVKRESDLVYAALADHWKAEVERLEQYSSVTPEEFIPGYKLEDTVIG